MKSIVEFEVCLKPYIFWKNTQFIKKITTNLIILLGIIYINFHSLFMQEQRCVLGENCNI